MGAPGTWRRLPAGFALSVGPVFIQFFRWVVALNLFQVGWRCLDLARGTWQRPRHAQKNVMQVLGLIPLVLLLTVPNHASVVLKHAALDQVRYGATVDAINLGV